MKSCFSWLLIYCSLLNALMFQRPLYNQNLFQLPPISKSISGISRNSYSQLCQTKAIISGKEFCVSGIGLRHGCLLGVFRIFLEYVFQEQLHLSESLLLRKLNLVARLYIESGYRLASMVLTCTVLIVPISDKNRTLCITF